MGDYEGNGDFSYSGDGSSDFKRDYKRDGGACSPKSDDDNDEGLQLSEKVNEYIRDLLAEKVNIDHKYPHADKLLEQEIAKAQQTGRIPLRDAKYVDIYREKPIRVTVKVLVPVKEHPKFNFVGKLLGPKGNSMKRLQEETMCKMAVLGRGSMKDRKKEEDLRSALDPKYAHLNDDLHVEISALAPPAEAHARVAYALAEVRKYLIPDSNDVIRQEQLRELIADGSIPTESEDGPIASKHYKSRAGAHIPRTAYQSTRQPVSRSPIPSGTSRTVMPAKQKILSILDRARNAMEETYPVYEEPIYEPPPQSHYDNYSYAHAPHSHAHVPHSHAHAPHSHAHAQHSHGHVPTQRSARYEVPEYETEYRRDYYHRETPAYAVKASSSSATGRSSWKSSSGGTGHTTSPYSSSRHEHESGIQSRHSHGLHSSHSRESRYRNSPYSRPKN